MNIIAVRLVDIVFFLSFPPDCGMHCRFSHKLSVTQYLFILFSKVTWNGHADCLSRGLCLQLCMDSCCFVLELGSAQLLRTAKSVLE
jgi:hypothetical protein